MRWRFGPLLAWLAIQLLALAIGAMRLPLTARSGTEPQHLAFAEMVVIQMAIGTMLAPIFVRERMTVAITLSALPFLQLAGFLTAVPIGPEIIASLAIVIWILGAGLWMNAIQSTQNRLVLIAVFNFLVLGGPILAYLIDEFSDSPNFSNAPQYFIYFPLIAIVNYADKTTISIKPLLAPLTLLVSGSIAILASRRSLSRAKLSTKLPTAQA